MVCTIQVCLVCSVFGMCHIQCAAVYVLLDLYTLLYSVCILCCIWYALVCVYVIYRMNCMWYLWYIVRVLYDICGIWYVSDLVCLEFGFI